MKFYSIDFAMINNQPYVVEVNAGVMLEKYSSLDKKKYANCCKIYEKVIIDSLK
jgi:glutathione synthase/RimK-type ligase-like ATP-grasp enzyme